MTKHRAICCKIIHYVLHYSGISLLLDSSEACEFGVDSSLPSPIQLKNKGWDKSAGLRHQTRAMKVNSAQKNDWIREEKGKGVGKCVFVPVRYLRVRVMRIHGKQLKNCRREQSSFHICSALVMWPLTSASLGERVTDLTCRTATAEEASRATKRPSFTKVFSITALSPTIFCTWLFHFDFQENCGGLLSQI